MPRFAESGTVVCVGRDTFGRDAWLAPEAGAAWAAMQAAAAAEDVTLLLISAFRSVERQTEIVRQKLHAGLPLDEILRTSAYPGHSEHHTGRAVDLGSPACAHLTEAFDATAEFRWLTDRAGVFGFRLTYPRENPHGLAYEPWHWCWHPGSLS